MKVYIALLSALLCAGNVGAQSVEPRITTVEFYNTTLNHYFMTADPNEQAAVDKGGAGPGWIRTGLSFFAYEKGQSATAKDVCRFYSKGQNSHFYTADAAECEQVKKDKGWQYEGLVFAIDVPSGEGTCAAGVSQPVYRVYNNGFGKAVGSNHRFMPDLTVAQKQAKNGQAFEGAVFCAPLSSAAKRADAVRLLKQASFGPTPAEINSVISQGANAWLDNQFAAPVSKYSQKPWVVTQAPATCLNDTTQPLRADSYCLRDTYSLFVPQVEFWKQALTGPDQLRQRVAWAWAQFFVVSGFEITQAYGMLDYQQMLRDNAFENYATLLRKVTLNSAMGAYLDMANNQKADPARGIVPNENFAREILQLFSIGTNELNLDGTPKLDAKGRTIPTYDAEEIVGFASAFTGWTYATIPGRAADNRFNVRNWAGPMEIREIYHDVNAKELLDGEKTKAAQNTQADFDAALNQIVNHRNVPPFVSRYLIQRLVTGEPSPAYVERVAKIFINNGAGTRGDLKAVVRAILTDAEARGPEKFDTTYGQLNEPVLHVAQMARALGVKTDGQFFQNQTAALGQNVFYSPTVFNYFSPEHIIASNKVNSPEFGILNSNTSISRANVANTLLMGSANINPSTSLFQSTGTQFDWSPYVAAAANTDTLLDKVAEISLGVPFSAQAKTIMKTAIEAIPATDPTTRAKTAMYLAFSTPLAQIKR
jgi:uncharacterized protein (DUF1800 family)